jgi:2-dehydro-3-deoxyphosphogluconate aldolase/(4S)-4-hydroxy-2-oxoglutarate aldolase
MSQSFSWEAFQKAPIVGIMRHIPRSQVEELARRYAGSGLTTLEITMNTRDSTDTIRHLRDTLGDRLNIGAGTVCTLEDLDKALGAGAQFIVTPILNEDVIRACVQAAIPIFPGAYTPTEIYRAWSLGAGMVKVFPATRLGTGYIKEVLAPLGYLKLIPTGGITLDNFTEFLQAGACGVGLGSHLFPGHLIEMGRWDELSGLFSAFVEKYRHFQHPHTI